MKLRYLTQSVFACSFAIAVGANAYTFNGTINFEKIWTTAHTFDSEINAVAGNKLYVTNPNGSLAVLNKTTGNLLETINLGGAPNSVAAYGSTIAVAVEGASRQHNGYVEFYDVSGPSAVSTAIVTVGALPDMLTFTPDGSKVVVANEGEPNSDYTIDPEGTVGIIDVSTLSYTSVDFGNVTPDASTRIFGPNASVAQDLEPEYIATNSSGTKAYVTLQENNAIGIIDINSGTVVDVVGLGFKDHSTPGNQFDASNRDDLDGNLQNWPTFGMYQPDAIDSFQVDGEDYFVIVNEGDARDYDGYSEEVRMDDLNPTPELEASLVANLGPDWQDDENLGRLKTTTFNEDNNGEVSQLFSYGARSFSILDGDGEMVFDSGSMIEEITLALGNWEDGRSDDKGPEPESVVAFELGGKDYIVIGNERTSDLMFFEVSDVENPILAQIISTVNLYPGYEAGASPEGLSVEILSDTEAVLYVSNEWQTATSAYALTAVPVPAAAWLFASALAGLIGRKKLDN